MMLGQMRSTPRARLQRGLPLTGGAVTKLDGDARGGAALSVRHVTGKSSSKFAGVGESLAASKSFTLSVWPAVFSAWATSCPLVRGRPAWRR